MECQNIVQLEKVSTNLEQLLNQDEEINEDKLFEKIGRFSNLLNTLLQEYAFSSPPVKQKLRPYCSYYRQLQHYLILFVRWPNLLKVPHHSEIEQTLSFIHNRDTLIQTQYIPIANNETNLFLSFKQELEEKWSQKEK